MNTEGDQRNSSQNLEPVKKNNLVFLNSFLRNQIDSAKSERR